MGLRPHWLPSRGAWSLLLALVPLVGCTPPSAPLSILYTNDIHATIHPTKAASIEGAPPVGGVVALERELARVRSSVRASLLLDAGDLLSGGPLSGRVDGGVKGGHMVRFMNLLGYDAMAIGNHDFDHGVDNVVAAAEGASFPFLAANAFTPDGALLVGSGSIVLRRGGIRIGIIGLVTPSVAHLVPRETAARFSVRAPLQVADSLASLLDPRTDLLILLSHCGLETDRFLARNLGPVVDLIVGGHSHDVLEAPERLNDVLIVQAGSRLRHLGRLDIVVKDDRIIDFHPTMILLRETGPSGDPATAVSSLADSLDAVIEAAYGDTVGWLDAPLTRAYYRESTLGNWVADAVRWYAKTDVAFVNSGTFRADLAAGALTARDIRDVLPFENTVVSFSCTGRELERLLRHNAEAALAQSHGILQVSGCSCRLGNGGSGASLEMRVDGAPLRPEATYTCATISFVAVQAPERYLGFVPSGVWDHSVLCCEAVEQAVRARAVTADAIEGRLVFDEAKGERR